MFSLCRLCATCTDPIELNTEMSVQEPRLVHCFGWRRSEKEIDMPKKACNSCVDRVKMSYDFVECMLLAENQLNKLLSERKQMVTDTILPESLEVKAEDMKVPVNDVPELGSDESFASGQKIEAIEYDDDNDAIFTEPIDFFNDGESECSEKDLPKKEIKKRPKKKRSPNDPFIKALDIEDRLEGGLISTNGLRKLEKLFPEMTTMSWQECQYKCETCDRTFKGSLSFYSHIRSIHIENVVSLVVPCFYCNSKHRREFTLNRHIATEHFPHLKYRCPYCPDYYWSMRDLMKHRSMHTDVQYTCELCHNNFTSRENFYGHCMSHLTKSRSDPNEKFICEICDKVFKTKGSIRNHMLLHTDKYDHVCEICGWKFQSKGNLRGHLASTHASVKPFQCDKCNRYFKTKHQLKNHAIMHVENYTPHVCSFCPASFRRQGTLKVHLRSHTGNCPYTCRYCGKKFRHGITLQTHERSHTNNKPYGCTHCEYRCTSKGNLNKHMMRAHSIDFRIYKKENQSNTEQTSDA